MIDKFFPKSDDSMFTIADLFGYFITFIVIWFIWTCYKGVSNVASSVSQNISQGVASNLGTKTAQESVMEHAATAPLRGEASVTSNEGEEVAGPADQPITDRAAVVKSNLAAHAKSLKSLISTEIDELPSPSEALYSINDSIKELINEVTDPSPVPRNRSGSKSAIDRKSDRASKRSEKDALAPL